MIPHDLFYAFMEGAYLIPIAVLLVWLVWRLYTYRERVLSSHFSKEVLKEILISRSQASMYTKMAALCLVWLFATLALMQPKGNGRYPFEKKESKVKLAKKVHEVIFLVDASASMEVNDTRNKKTRLSFSKEIVDELVSRMNGESVALYAFTSDTTKLSPPTMDYFFVRLMLRDMEINEGAVAGTDFAEALSILDDDVQKQKTVILLSDGGDTQIEELADDERKSQINALLSQLSKKKVQVFTIGLGTKAGGHVPDAKEHVAKLDEELMQTLAVNGNYYFANDWTALELADDLMEKLNQLQLPYEDVEKHRLPGTFGGEDDLVYDLYFQFPLFFALLFLIWILYFPETRVRQ